MHNHTGKHSAGIVIAATLFVLALLLALVLLSIRGGQRNVIQLPEDLGAVDGELPLSDVEEPFLQLDTENVQMALGTLSRSTAYHQVLSVSTLWDQEVATQTVQLWRSGSCLRAQLSVGSDTKHLLTDGTTVWIWYGTDGAVRSLTLDETVSFDDLLGIPTYETLLALPESQILDAGFVTFDESQSYDCLYIAVQEGEQEARYWVDVNAQLLYRADALEGDTPVYQLRQTSCQLLTPENTSLQEMFQLPDGTKILPSEE